MSFFIQKKRVDRRTVFVGVVILTEDTRDVVPSVGVKKDNAGVVSVLDAVEVVEIGAGKISRVRPRVVAVDAV